MDAAEDDQISVLDFLRLARQLKGIADKIRHLKNLRPLIIVRQHDRILIALEPPDLVDFSRIAIAGFSAVAIAVEYIQFGKEISTGNVFLQVHQGSFSRP